MHEGLTGDTIGRRIAGWRRARGFKSARELADAIPGEAITAPVLQNIEAGRKADIAVSQLLSIAYALRVPPTFLLFPMAASDRTPDLVGVSDDVANYRVGFLEAWFASEFSPYPSPMVELVDLDSVRAQRELLMLRTEVERLERSVKLERIYDSQRPPTAEELESRSRWDTTAARLEGYRARIEELEELLAREGWPVEGTGSDGVD